MRTGLRIALGVLVADAVVALVLVLPHWLSDARAAEFARAGCFFIAIVGLNVLTGYTGQISHGHVALMAVGAYTTAILTADHGLRDLWTIPLAGLVAMAAGFVLTHLFEDKYEGNNDLLSKFMATFMATRALKPLSRS